MTAGQHFDTPQVAGLPVTWHTARQQAGSLVLTEPGAALSTRGTWLSARPVAVAVLTADVTALLAAATSAAIVAAVLAHVATSQFLLAELPAGCVELLHLQQLCALLA